MIYHHLFTLKSHVISCLNNLLINYSSYFQLHHFNTLSFIIHENFEIYGSLLWNILRINTTFLNKIPSKNFISNLCKYAKVLGFSDVQINAIGVLICIAQNHTICNDSYNFIITYTLLDILHLYQQQQQHDNDMSLKPNDQHTLHKTIEIISNIINGLFDIYTIDHLYHKNMIKLKLLHKLSSYQTFYYQLINQYQQIDNKDMILLDYSHDIYNNINLFIQYKQSLESINQ